MSEPDHTKEPDFKDLNRRFNEFMEMAEREQDDQRAMLYTQQAQAIALRMQVTILDAFYYAMPWT